MPIAAVHYNTDDPFEVGLGFCVDFKKEGRFIGPEMKRIKAACSSASHPPCSSPDLRDEGPRPDRCGYG
jgi:hypothetical protein